MKYKVYNLKLEHIGYFIIGGSEPPYVQHGGRFFKFSGANYCQIETPVYIPSLYN